jgi:hypothetical protein
MVLLLAILIDDGATACRVNLSVAVRDAIYMMVVPARLFLLIGPTIL